MSQNFTPLLNLIREHCNISLVQDLLKSRDEKHSAATWDILIEKRLIPALNRDVITELDLHELLRVSEEYGRQHVFLYKCSATRATDMCTIPYLTGKLAEIGMSELLVAPKILEMPTIPTLVDARIDYSDGLPSLVLKVAEPRDVWKPAVTEIIDGRLHRISDPATVRCTNVARLSADGTLEVRIASKSNGNQYESDLTTFLTYISRIIPQGHFREVSLATAKRQLSAKSEELRKIVRVSQIKFRDVHGFSITASSSAPDLHLSSSERIEGAVGSFNNEVDATFCEHNNLWFLEVENQEIPTREMHVLISGNTNEFAVTSKCSQRDYEYVLKTVSSFNSPIP